MSHQSSGFAVLLTGLSWSTVEQRVLVGAALDRALGLLLRLMALQYNTRPRLRRLLRGADGWIDFTVGIAVEGGAVARTVRFASGKVSTSRGIAPAADVVLRFRDDAALRTMLLGTPNEVMTLILRSELVPDGNWAYLQLFSYLLSRLVGRRHQRMLDAERERDAATRRARYDQHDPSISQELHDRAKQRLPGQTGEDAGVRHLDDPYLSELGLDDFPRLAGFLRDHLDHKPAICAERPLLMTQWFRRHGFEVDRTGEPWDAVARQGRVLRHVLANKRPVIRDGDPLPGSTTSHAVTGSVVFPDGQGTLIWGELESIDRRTLIPFDIAPQTARTLHRDVFPFWAGRNFREWVRAEFGYTDASRLGERWVAYFVWKAVGISHTVPDLERLLRLGTSGIAAEISAAEAEHGGDDPERAILYGSMRNCLVGVDEYAENLADEADRLSAPRGAPERVQELIELGRICRRVPREPATTLHEAFVSLWLVWVALHNENADTGLSLGRLDQLLQPYFEADLARLRTKAARKAYVRRAVELAGAFFMRCTDHFPLTPDIANTLFGGASSTQALTLGGVTPDGKDAVNDMTYVFLKATEMLSIRDVNVNARFAPGINSEHYLRRLCEVNFVTAGTPSLHNDDAVFASLRPHGYSEEEIRDWSITGCVEPTITGRHMAHTGSVLMNVVAGLEMALFDGRHPLIGSQIGPHTGDPAAGDFPDFESFFEAYAIQQRFLIASAVEVNNQLAAVHARHRPTPLLSALIGGTLESGRDVTRGGAEHNTSGTSNIGLADVVDSLLVIRKLVFEEQQVSFSRLIRALESDFEDDPSLRALAQSRVRLFGSGDAEAVAMANRVARFIHDTWASQVNFRGGCYTTGFWSMSQHVAYGNLSGALPSGRLRHKAFTPGLTPQPAATKSFLDNLHDVAGLDPTTMDNNMAFNVKLAPGDDCVDKIVDTMAAYARTYFDLGGMQLQFNVLTADTLRDAMAHPDDYRGLLVRISGYNAYFVTLNEEIQLELIERAEFGL